MPTSSGATTQTMNTVIHLNVTSSSYMYVEWMVLSWFKVHSFLDFILDFNTVSVSFCELSFLLQPSLVVNVASDCGFTDQHYRDLVRISKDPHLEGRLNILAFPCNQFGYQEPRSNREIKQFIQAMYDVEFPLFSKVDVIGYDADPAWQYLTSMDLCASMIFYIYPLVFR